MRHLFFTAVSRLLRVHLGGVALVGLILLAVPAFALDTGFQSPTATHSPNGWTNPTNAFASDNSYATATTDDADQGYSTFSLSLPANSYITGIQVTLEAFSSDSSGCEIEARLSWNNGANFTNRKTANLTGSDTVLSLGDATDNWGRVWSTGEFSNANFVVEVRNNDPGTNCTNGSTTSLDHVRVKVFYDTVTANPELTETCGLDMALVMDISTSIDSDEYAEMVDAMETFVTALDGTPTHFSLVVFATDATVVHGFTEDGTAIIDEMTPRPGNGFTNWDDALRAARGLFPHRPNPDLIMFASDGNPNRRGGSNHPNPDTELGHSSTVQSANESEAMQWAIEEANAAKTSDIRLISVGIGNDLDTVNLAAVASSDAVVTADFGTLAAALLEVAEALCGGTITVHKVIDDDGDTGTTGDQHDGEDWTFTCNALSPDSCIPLFDVTDTEGLIGFEIDLGADTTATVNMVETGKTGYTFVSANCLDKGTTAVGTPGVGTVTDIPVTAKNIIACTFYNTPLCGDGLIISPETCDDDNTTSGDGCSSTCQIEPGYGCTGEPSTCSPVCGDSIITNPETCDDGNTASDDGCSNTCQTEPGYTCTGTPSVCSPTCGNGTITGAETCDDNNTSSGDGCSSTCQIEPGYGCTGEPSTCSPVCGDGTIISPETCDDNNTTNGDGCSSTCQTEPGYGCTEEPSVCSPVCGDGIITSPETCDDNNTTSGDGCSSTCAVESGYSCTGEPSSCSPVCGDGIITSPETCDDGNTNSEDGCSATCQVECVNPQTDCPAPSQCQIAVCEPTTGNGAICGTSNVSDGTSCDDGNACTQTDTCQAGSCSGSNPVICTAQDQCHDAGTCDPQIGVCSNPTRPDGTTCNDGNSQTTNDRCQAGNCEGDLPPASTCGNGIIEAGETCDDANLLNGDGCSSTCQDECVNPVVDCQLSDLQCEVAACVATTGGGARCKINNKPNGTACNDGSSATSPDQCYQGDCVGGFAYPACAPVACEPWTCGTPTVVGTAKNETLSGTIRDDVIAGNGGNDTVKAMEGNDCVLTGSGKDRVEGQKGNDKIIDTGGANTLNGGEGQDCILGGPNTDTISGDDGCDVILGSDGDDTIEGRWGGDVIDGGAGNDKIFGNEGSDLIYGGEGSDTIDGGSEGGDVDSCDGGPGTDTCKNCEITINCEVIK